MGIRSAIASKIFGHMHKHDKERRKTEKGVRSDLRTSYQGNMTEAQMGDAKHFTAQSGELKAALAHSKERQAGSGLRGRFRDKMEKWSLSGAKKQAAKRKAEGAEDSYEDDKNHNVALPKWTVDLDQNNRLAEFEDLIKGQHRAKKKARHFVSKELPSAPAETETAPEAVAPAPHIHKKKRLPTGPAKQAPRPVSKWQAKQDKKRKEESFGESFQDDKNHNVALPKWTVDVDQDNRLAEFEDLIKGQHRVKKKARHFVSGDSTLAPAVAEPAPEAVVPAPRMRKGERPGRASEPADKAVETPLPRMKRSERLKRSLEDEDMPVADPATLEMHREDVLKRRALREARTPTAVPEIAPEPMTSAPQRKKTKQRHLDEDLM